jgi:hypothetical protein
MRRLLLLASLCLLAAPALAQQPPGPEQVLASQRATIRAMKRLSFTKRVTVEELDERGRVTSARAYSYRLYMRDDATLATNGVLVSAVKLKSWTAVGLDRAVLSRPLFAFGEPDYLGEDGGLYVFRTGRPWLDGRVWADARGRIVRAEGLFHPCEPRPGEAPLLMSIRMDPRTGLPAEETGTAAYSDKNGKRSTLRVRGEYEDWREHKSSVQVLDIGDLEP